jgi:nucleoside-diphosphate-sugar epimerase
VLATTRSGHWGGGPLPEGVHLSAWDSATDDDADLANVIGQARSIVVGWSSGGGGQDRRAVFVGGAQRLDAALERLPSELRPRRLVYLSSTAALPNVDAWLDESIDAQPLTERGLVQREAEDQIRATAERLDIPWVILRSAGIYGPGRDLGRLYRRDPTAVRPGNGLQPTNLIHRDDLVTAIVAALGLDAAKSALVHVCDDDHCSRREMIQRVAGLSGGPPPRWEIAADPGAPAVGKRVNNRRLKTLLQVRLEHPTHLPAEPDQN